MITLPTEFDDRAIHANFMGGLNSTSNPLNISPEDAANILNMDPSEDGILRKRKGTVSLRQYTHTTGARVHGFISNLGYGFITSSFEDKWWVGLPYDDNIKWEHTFDGVFTEEDLFFTSLPGHNARVLALNSSQTPTQLLFIERRTRALGGTNTYTLEDIPAGSLVLAIEENGDVQECVFNDVDQVTLVNPVIAGTKLDFIAISWQWWAESITWYGDNFYQSLPRSGAAPIDQNVLVPNELISDLNTNDEKYSLRVYADNQYNNTYVYRPAGQPRTEFDWSYGDGSPYEFGDGRSTIKSPNFITFGKEANAVTFTFDDYNIRSANNIIYYPNHGLEDFDIIRLESTFNPPNGVDITQPMYVRRINDNRFELYEDIDLTIQVPISKYDVLNTFDSYVNWGQNFVRYPAPGHGLAVGEIHAIRVEPKDDLMPVGIVRGQTYYAFALTDTVLEIYYDEDATLRVDLMPPLSYNYRANRVNAADDTIFFPNHVFSNGQRVRFRALDLGTLDSALVEDRIYFLLSSSEDTIRVYEDEDLTNLVDLQGDGVNSSRLWYDSGRWNIRVVGGTYTLNKEPFDRVDIARLRQLRFNADLGIKGENLDVTVNWDAVIQGNNTPEDYSYQLYTNTDFEFLPDQNRVMKRIGFTGSQLIGLPGDAVVRMTNTEVKHCGANAVADYRVNGGWIPIYGLGLFCDYDTGLFPSCGAVIRGRLVLGGMASSPTTVLFSAIGNYKDWEEYSYYQITNDLTPDALDPFDLRLDSNVVGLQPWQDALFAFTDIEAYRVVGEFTPLETQTILISSKGLVNKHSVTATENSILFVSSDAVYDISPILEGEYRTADVSIKISNRVSPYLESPDTWIAFDKATFKLYLSVEGNRKHLYVYNTRIQSWTEYDTPGYFDVKNGSQYYDNIRGREFIMDLSSPCNSRLFRTEGDYYLDMVTQSSFALTVTPSFTIQDIIPGAEYYDTGINYVPLQRVKDVIVFLGDDLGNWVEHDDWEKVQDQWILVRNTDGYSRIVFAPCAGWYCNVVVENDAPFFGTVNFDNPCVCDLGGYTTGTCTYTVQGEMETTGRAYTAFYVSPMSTLQTISHMKSHRNVSIHMRHNLNRETPTKVLKHGNELNVGAIYARDYNGEVREELFSYNIVQQDRDFTLFRESLQDVSYAAQLVIYSCTRADMQLAAFQTIASTKGRTFISGEHQ